MDDQCRMTLGVCGALNPKGLGKIKPPKNYQKILTKESHKAQSAHQICFFMEKEQELELGVESAGKVSIPVLRRGVDISDFQGEFEVAISAMTAIVPEEGSILNEATVTLKEYKVVAKAIIKTFQSISSTSGYGSICTAKNSFHGAISHIHTQEHKTFEAVARALANASSSASLDHSPQEIAVEIVETLIHWHATFIETLNVLYKIRDRHNQNGDFRGFFDFKNKRIQKTVMAFISQNKKILEQIESGIGAIGKEILPEESGTLTPNVSFLALIDQEKTAIEKLKALKLRLEDIRSNCEILHTIQGCIGEHSQNVDAFHNIRADVIGFNKK